MATLPKELGFCSNPVLSNEEGTATQLLYLAVTGSVEHPLAHTVLVGLFALSTDLDLLVICASYDVFWLLFLLGDDDYYC